MSDEKLVVLHSSRRWLKQTKTWIYRQLKSLPEIVEAHVVCDATSHLDQFAWPRLHTLEGAPRWRRGVEALLRRGNVSPFRFPVRVARMVGAQILHSHFGPEGYRELAIAKTARLKHVVTFYGYDVTRLPRDSPLWCDRYKELFSRVDCVLCEGPHMRGELLALGCAPEKVKVQHLGADLSLIPFQPRRWKPEQTLRVLIAASFREKKGIPFALRALAELQGARPSLRLEISVIGDAGQLASEQKEKAEIMRAAAEGGFGERLKFLGYRSHVQLLEVAQDSHVFLSPSVRASDGDTEGGAPVTIVELAASGMPIVSTTHCDIPNVLRGPAAHLLADERDVAGLAERLCRLVDGAEGWQTMLETVRGDIEQRFDAAALGQSLAQIYTNLVK